MNLPPDHQLEPVPPLRDRRERRVVRTRVAGRACVTRVFLEQPVSRRYALNLEMAALRGTGQLHGLPRSVELPFAGYLCAARLGVHSPSRLPRVVAAGVTPDGFAFVTTEWIAGPTVRELLGSKGWDGEAVLLDVLRALETLHAARVVYGDLKPENVVVSEAGHVVLIDLDTLREVPDSGHGAPTLDVTRSWAAPEQLNGLAWLASDLWAWAGLVGSVYPGGPPAPWAALVDACRVTDPLVRPTTWSLLRRLGDPQAPLVDWRGQPVVEGGPRPSRDGLPVEGTERVPDTPGTDRVDEAPATDRVPEDPPTDRVPDAPAPAPARAPAAGTPPDRGGLGLLRVLGAAAVAIVLCCGAPYGVAQVWNSTYVDRRADDLSSALRAYKTDPARNRDPSQPALIEEMTNLPWYHWPTPRFAAVTALARVWAARLQDRGTSWDERRFGRLEAATSQGGDRVEALVARGSLYSHGCRVRRAHPSSAGMCERAETALDGALAALGDEEATRWLRVEALWARIQVGALLAAEAQSAGLPGAAARRAAVQARCAEALPILDYAPVNGPELVEDCHAYAGASGELADYLRWSAWIVDHDARDGQVTPSTYQRLYHLAAPGCEGTVQVSRDRRKQLVFSFSRRADPWCVAVGHGARGCPERSREVIEHSRTEAPDHPWDMLLAALPADSRPDCLR